MKTLSIPLLVLLGSLSSFPAAAAAVSAGPAVMPLRCEPAAKPAVPRDYLFYHGLVAPHAALSERRPAPAACATRRGVRT
jgi:hypothetical protein